MSTRDVDTRICLANAANIRVGRMELLPSVREVRLLDTSVTIEPRVMQVLMVLAQAEGRTVSRDELVRRCWAGAAVSEDAINRVMSRTRRVAALDEERSFAIETVPRVGYRLRSVPEIEQRADDGIADAPMPRIDEKVRVTHEPWTRRQMVLAGLAGAGTVAGLGLTGARWFVGAGRPRIAVLPFDADSPAQRVLARGLSNALIGALAGVPDIDVVARSSSFALDGSDKAQAQRLLGATYLVDGAVTGEAADETVSVDLIDAAAQSIVWSQRYPVQADSLAALRARIARDTGAVLHFSIASAGSDAIAPTDFRTFLQAEGALLQTPPLAREAVALLTGVTARAPSFAPGWTALAAANLLAQGRLDPDAAVPPTRAAARAAAMRATEAGPRSALGYALLASAIDRQGHWSEIGHLLDKAIALEPTNPQALYLSGGFLADIGANAKAIEHLQRAWRLDPLNADAAFLLLRVLEAAGRESELDALLARARAMWPDDPGIWRFAACRAVWLHRFDEVRRLTALAPAHGATEARYFTDLAACVQQPDSPFATQFLAPLSGPLPAFWPIAIFALAMIGRHDACLSLIRRVFLSPRGRAEAPTWVLLQAILQPLWREAAFRTVLGELGLLAYWRAAGITPLERASRTLADF